MEAPFRDKFRVFKDLSRVLSLVDGLLYIEVGQVVVQWDSVRHNRLGERHIRGQNLKILLDRFGGRAGVLLRVGDDDGQTVAAFVDFLAGDNGERRDAAALDARYEWRAVEIVGALDVLGC